MSAPLRSVMVLFVALLSAGAIAVAVEPVSEVTRQDVARSLLAFERAFVEHPPQGADRERVGRAFDAVVTFFFRGDFPPAIERMDALTHALLPEAERTPARRAALALRVRPEPAVLPADADAREVTIEARPLYAAPAGAVPQAVRLRVRSPEGEVIHQAPLPAAGGRLTWDVPADLPTGRYVLEIEGEPRGELFLTARLPSAVREEVTARLGRLAFEDRELQRSLLAARSRAALLADEIYTAQTTRFLADQAALVDSVPREVALLEAGQNPYLGRSGDYWRTIDAPGLALSVPARVHAPRDLPPGAPLVIALHGAGADEHIFMDGYGLGEIRRLADRHGFLVVSPLTYVAMTDVRSFDAIVETAEALHGIDRERVYVIGHSLGAITAGLWMWHFPERLAGVGMIAGGRPEVLEAVPVPLYIAAAEHDRIFPLERLRRAAEVAATRGPRVEFHFVPGAGHVTLVPEVLPPMIEWLLEEAQEGVEGQ